MSVPIFLDPRIENDSATAANETDPFVVYGPGTPYPSPAFRASAESGADSTQNAGNGQQPHERESQDIEKRLSPPALLVDVERERQRHQRKRHEKGHHAKPNDLVPGMLPVIHWIFGHRFRPIPATPR